MPARKEFAMHSRASVEVAHSTGKARILGALSNLKSRNVGMVALLTLLGIGFSLSRVALRLDEAPLQESLAAFALLLGIAAGLGRFTRLTLGELGLSRAKQIRAVLGTAFVASTLVGAALITAPQMRLPNLTQVAAGLAFFGLGTAPAEELLFRGVLYGIVRRESNAVSAVLISSIAFSIAHAPVYGIGSLPVSIVAGLLFGWLRWWSGSLLATMFVHVAADLSLLWL